MNYRTKSIDLELSLQISRYIAKGTRFSFEPALLPVLPDQKLEYIELCMVENVNWVEYPHTYRTWESIVQ